MSAASASSQPPKASPALTIARVLLVLWAGFWAWFVASVGLSEGLFSSPYPATGLALLAVLVAAAWRKPVLGGLLLLAFAAFSAYLFRAGAQALLGVSLPALLLGLSFLVLGPRRNEVRS